MGQAYTAFELQGDITTDQLNEFIDHLKATNWIIIGAISDVPMNKQVLVGRKAKEPLPPAVDGCTRSGHSDGQHHWRRFDKYWECQWCGKDVMISS